MKRSKATVYPLPQSQTPEPAKTVQVSALPKDVQIEILRLRDNTEYFKRRYVESAEALRKYLQEKGIAHIEIELKSSSLPVA